jgi:hypothetical protein
MGGEGGSYDQKQSYKLDVKFHGLADSSAIAINLMVRQRPFRN